MKMNEELQKALGELLSKANDGIDAASGFLVAELPEVIQQLLSWHCVLSLVWAIVFVVMFITSIKLFLWGGGEDCKGSEMEVVVWLLTALGGVVTFFLAINRIIEALQIWIAPKVWLIEYAASLAS